ncbi:MAG: GNAT family N-acetyltransferase [Steroidobacteraceae bacterium]
MKLAVHSSIDQIAPSAWNALAGERNPFIRHEFLAALEHTGCVGAERGWQPCPLTLSDEHGLAGAALAYLKSHSFGEFVFDFAWAEAYARHGLEYYPKITVAVPFTPASGARLLVRADLDPSAVRARLLGALAELSAAHSCSSVHALFVEEPDRAACASAGWQLRRDCQFQWRNRGYRDFEDYLAGFTAEKRKKARRERRRVEEAGIHFLTRFGPELDPSLLDQVYAFHRETFRRHGQEPYLTRAFFEEIVRTMGDALMVKIAVHGSQPVAAAVFFWSREALWGRYWGATEDYHSLHFETCYHQGIEFCIERNIERFEPGTQGEHKIARGFEPTLTWSAHEIRDRRFREAIGQYLAREADWVDGYVGEVRAHVPFRKDRP